MKLIPLTQGKFAKVDDEDHEMLSQFKWHSIKSKTSRDWYAKRRPLAYEGFSRSVSISMHRMILSLDKKDFVDHINNNGLDNRRENLRSVTKSQNAINWKRNHGKYGHGISFRPEHPKKWCARIQVNGKRKHIGYFNTREEARAAYKQQATILHGQYQAT